jgi:anthranilate phosphoribosyltransferase
MRALLSGKGSQAEIDLVSINAGALLMTAGLSEDLRMGVALARDALRSGKAGQLLTRFVEASND